MKKPKKPLKRDVQLKLRERLDDVLAQLTDSAARHIAEVRSHDATRKKLELLEAAHDKLRQKYQDAVSAFRSTLLMIDAWK